MREGTPLPKRIQNAPELFLGLGLFYNAFWDLCSSRNSGYSVGEIPWHVIHQYCQFMDLSSEQTQDMHIHIAGMDRAYIEFVNKKK